MADDTPGATTPEEPTSPQHLALAEDFPTPTRDEWRTLVQAVLAKSGVSEAADPEVELSYTTYDDIVIKPLYTADDGHPPQGAPGKPSFVRGSRPVGNSAARGWDVRTRYADPDAARTNAAILNDLETGATSLWLVVGEGGLDVDDLPAALQGVFLDLAPIVLEAGDQARAAADSLIEMARRANHSPHLIRGSVGADPIGRRARSGAPVGLDELSALTDLYSDDNELLDMKLATVDATIYHAAGASDAQEVGIGTAVGVAYLRALVDGGLPVWQAFDALEFRWSVTAEQFPSIAKLRAARRVWDRVAELSGAGDDRLGQYQHAVTSAAMMTRRDPWVNMLRTTIGCFAAAVGGADAVTVLPFDHAIGVPDDFSRRVARNTQAVLHDESSLGRVLDPAGGSWFVESLTDELAEKAWEVFTVIERAGGALAALDDGTIDDLLANVRTKRDDDIAHRRAPITGVSEFAFVAEPPVERTPWPAALREGLLPSVRYASAFEHFRDIADAQAERPKVFLATLGPAAVNSARAGFAGNLFQAGGFEVVTGPVDEFAQSGAKLACLCSSDKTYEDEAASAAASLRAAGATYVWLAGKGDYEGVDARIFAGCNVIDVLQRAYDELGVPA